MAFYTNYVDNAYTDGAQIPVGDKKHVFLRKLCNEIISVSAGEWLEATGAGPTPTAIQAYASTISTGVVNGDAVVQGSHITLYRATDPNIGSEEAVLIRFYINDYDSTTDWCKIAIMDMSSDETWSYIDSDNAGTYGISQDHGWGFTTASSTATVATEQRVYVFGDDGAGSEMAHMGFFLFDVTNGWVQNCVVFMTPESVSNYTRGDYPYAFAAVSIDAQLPWTTTLPTNNTNPNNGYGYVTSAAYGADPGVAGCPQQLIPHTGSRGRDETNWDADVGQNNMPLGEAGEVIMGRMTVLNRTHAMGYIGAVPRIRILREDVVSDMEEFTADSRTWLAMNANQNAYTSGNLMRWCVDVTPDPT